MSVCGVLEGRVSCTPSAYAGCPLWLPGVLAQGHNTTAVVVIILKMYFFNLVICKSTVCSYLLLILEKFTNGNLGTFQSFMWDIIFMITVILMHEFQSLST